VNKEIAIGAFTLVVALAIALAVAFFSQSTPPSTPAPAPATTTASPTSGEAPALSPEAAAAFAKSHGFQYLVSYTDRGFEPPALSVKKGETVRFSNNSKDDLWIAATDQAGALYPNVANGCGSSALDTCKALKGGDFWEFTFDVSGTWSYKNNSDTSKTGTVTVQ